MITGYTPSPSPRIARLRMACLWRTLACQDPASAFYCHPPERAIYLARYWRAFSERNG